MGYQWLSYPLNIADPGFPGEPTLSIEPSSSIDRGDMYNSAVVHLFNHFGTHFDAPKHFNQQGPSITELPLAYFIYSRPLLIDIPSQPGRLLLAEDFAPFMAEIAQADLLLIRTGLEKVRQESPEIYAKNGGAVSVEAAKYLIDHASHLKAIGFDFISLASPAYPAHGVEAHQVLLGMYQPSHYICIIEDMKLSQVNKAKLKKVLALPLRVEGVDSAQVTVLAEEV